MKSFHAVARQDTLNQLPTRLYKLEDRVRLAEQDIAVIDRSLAEAETQFRAYLAATEALRAKLTQWTARAIG